MKPPLAHRPHSRSRVLDSRGVVRASSLQGASCVVRASSLHPRSRRQLVAALLFLNLTLLPAALGLDVLWRDSFEGFNLQLRWEITAGVWEMGNPTTGPGAPPPGGGTNVAATVLNGNYPEGVDTWLIRRQSFRVPESNPRLRFRHWFNFNWDDYGQVQVREVGGEWETLATYPQVLWTCGRWEQASLSLAKYAGKEVQVGFLFHSQIYRDGRSYVAEGWYLDDVAIISGPMEFRNPENFEAPDFWDHWYADNGMWEVGVPTGAPAERHDGSQVAGTIIDGNYCDAYFGRDSRLVSPVTVVPALPNPRLRFRHWFHFSWDDYGQVQVREVGGEWETLATYPQVLWTCGRWEPASLSLAKYAGKEVQVGFLFHSQIYRDGRSYVAEGWYLDDVAIISGSMEFRNPEGFEAPDFWDHWYADNGMWEVGVPTGAPAERHNGSKVAGTIIDGDYCDAYFGRDSRLVSPVTVVPALPNPRLRFRHWFHFSWDDYGQVQVREVGGEWEPLATYPQVLWTCGRWEPASLSLAKYAGKEVQVGFLFHSQIYRDGKSYVAEGWYLDDVEVVSGPMEFRNPEGFEAPDFWDHWHADNGVWEVGVPTGAPAERHNGSKVAGTIIDGDYCDAHFGRDSRLVSPVTVVPALPNPRLRFRHWFHFSWDDSGQVQVREVGGEWETLAIYPQVLWTCGRWEQASLSLAKYAGKEVQVGFLFHSQIYRDGRSYVAEGWYLDDVAIVSGPVEFRNPEGFEAPDFWDHWYTDNGVWEVGVPSHGPTNAFQGVRVAGTILDGDYCDSYYGRDSRLIGPWLRLPVAGSPTLTFQHWYDFSLDDFGAVEVRTPDGSWEEVSRFTANSAGKWYPASSSLAKYAGKDVQIAFRFHSQINSNGRSYVAPGWYLDQLEIRTGLLRVEPEAILFDGLVLDELTTGTFWARGALPGWRYGLAEGAPDGAAMDPDLGLVTWIPAECQGPALTFITLALFNEQNQPMDLLEVPVIVLEVDEAPRIGAIPDLRIDAGVPVSLDASRYAYDPDCPAQVLTYSLDTPSPSNAAVDPQTGVLDWIPTAEQAAQTNILVLRVTDDTGLSATQTVRAGPFDVDPTAPRIGQLRLAGSSLELTLLDITPGQVIRLEATAALQNPATATVWTEVQSFTWQTNPVVLEGIINGDHPAEFFRLSVSGQR